MTEREREIIAQYIADISARHITGEATEHTYRGPFENMLCQMLGRSGKDSCISIINEPRRKEFGAPDFELRRGLMIISFIETKDIDDTDLRGTKKSMNKQQFDRYKAAISTIAFTNFREFVLYEGGKEVMSVCIATIDDDGIIRMTDDEKQLSAFVALIEKLAHAKPQPITSAKELASIMAAKARLMATLIEQHLQANKDYTYDEDWDDPSELRGQYEAFRQHLIADLTEKAFADIYAQTITYGLFAARLHTTTPETFTRAEVPWFIPQTTPFLRSIFSIIAGADLDKNVAWIVDDLTKAFRAVNVKRVMKLYNSTKEHYDPLLHFYEDFLAAFDPQARKDNGVWYTPHSIVGFMVRSVDELLQRDFGLADGLASTELIEKDERQYHRVQILDPATGTGTFLAEIVNQIYDRFRAQPGLWQQYVENDLLPRLNGFEILMASYAVAHLKLDMVLQQTGYQERSHKRLRIFLTNSLEDQRLQPISLFDYKLARESNLANAIKKRYPVMVMIGNPPYNNSSNNNSVWIRRLIEQYKTGVDARKINLDDDYVKFIRMGQHYIEHTGEGVMAFVTNNNYLDAITFKAMRHSLLKSFDDIYILDLHGKVKNHEKSPDGSPDENVFGITLGVSIAIFVRKSGGNQQLGCVHHCDLYGKKRTKKDFLNRNTLSTVEWTELTPSAPDYYFTPKDFSMKDEYEQGFGIDELFVHYNSGVQTKRDKLNVFFSDAERKTVLRDFKEGNLIGLHKKYKLHDSRDWTVERAIKDLQEHPVKRTRLNYRPFDDRYTNYTGYSRGIMGYPREKTNQYLQNDNLSLITCKQQSSFPFQHVFVTRLISDLNSISAQSKEQSYVFPLYIYDEAGNKSANFNEKISQRISPDTDPQTIFDYVYAVLHSNHYRKRYKELLRVGFPRIPYPKTPEQMRNLAVLGARLRRLHLLDGLPSGIGSLGISYHGNGNDTVLKGEWRDGAVWINADNRFEGIAEEVWNHYIGGYQPMQSWLQYRSGRCLTMEELIHYERMAYALQKSIDTVKEIELFEV